MAAGTQLGPTSRLQINVFDGSRKTATTGLRNVFVRAWDGNQRLQINHALGNGSFAVPVFNNLGDDYRVVVTADGCPTTSFHPVTIERVAGALLPKKVAGEEEAPKAKPKVVAKGAGGD